MSDDWLAEALDWFFQIEEHLPFAGTWAADLMYGPIPDSDAVAIYALADQWERLATTLNEAYEDVARQAEPILENWSGDGAALAFHENWRAYLDGLRQTADGAGQMRQAVQNFGLEVELMKFMAFLNLLMLMFSLYLLIAAAVVSFGGSLAGAPALFASARIALQQAVTQTIRNISSITMRVALQNIAKLFARVPAGLAAARTAAGTALTQTAPRILANAGTRIYSTGANLLTRDGLVHAARTAAGQGISRAVANRMTAQALRGMTTRGVGGGVANRLAAAQAQAVTRRELSRAIQRQLMNQWTGRVVREGANATIENIARQQIARSLGREFAGFVGSRVAIGAAFMGGGNLVGQVLQIWEGRRTEGIDWGQVVSNTVQGGVYGAGMFGGPLGHAIGGGFAGGTVALGQEIIHLVQTGEGINWNTVGHSAVQGAAMGIIMGGQTHLETSHLGALGSRIGRDVQVLPGENGGFNVVSAHNTSHGSRGLLLTHDGYVAFEGRGRVEIPDEVASRPDAMRAIDEHWKGRGGDTGVIDAPPPAAGAVGPPRVDTPAGPGANAGPRVDAPAARTDTAAPARGGDGGGGGGGPRQNVPADGGPRGGDPASTDGTRGGDPARPDGTRGAGTDRAADGTRDGAPTRTDNVDDGGRGDSGRSGSERRDGEVPLGGRPGEDGPPPGTVRGADDAGVTPQRAGADGEPGVSPAGRSGESPVDGRVGRDSGGGDPPARVTDGGGTRTDGGVGPRADSGPVTRADESVVPRADGGVGPRGADPATAGRSDDGGPPRSREQAGPRAGVDAPARSGEAPTRAGEDSPSRAGDGPPSRADDGAPSRAGDDAPGRAGDDAPSRVGDEAREEPLASAGAERGEDPTPRSIEQGTVRMEEHPDFARTVADLNALGFSLQPSAAGHPHTVIRHVIDPQTREVIRVEQEVRVVEGMRYLDLEHEIGHVRQVTDPNRFPDGPPATEVVRERPGNTPKEVKNAPGVLRNSQNTIAEYHVRLEEYLRLAERGVDGPLLAEHARGVAEHRDRYNDVVGNPYKRADADWAHRVFPEILALERQFDAVRAAAEDDTPAPGRPFPPRADDGPPLSKMDPEAPTRVDEPARVEDGARADGAARADDAARAEDGAARVDDGARADGAARVDDAARADGAARVEDGVPPRDDPPSDTPESPNMASAGHEMGVDPSPRSIEQGTVRFREHPDFPRLEAELQRQGVEIVSTDRPNPEVEYRRVVDPKTGELIRIEREMHVIEGMRYLDFEHEFDHVRQMEDPNRFPDETWGTNAVRETPNGYARVNNAPYILGPRIDVVEYHVRLMEVERLFARGVDPEILDAHLRGLDSSARDYHYGVERKPKISRWQQEHFPDIPELRDRVAELRAAYESGSPTTRSDGPGPHPDGPGPRADGDGGNLAKRGVDDGPPVNGRREADGDPDHVPAGARGDGSGGLPVRDAGGDGPHAGDRQGESAGPSGGRDRGQDVRGGAVEDPAVPAAGRGVADAGVVRGVEPARLVDVPGRAPEDAAHVPDGVAAVLNAEVESLTAGRRDGSPDLPERAGWDADSQTVRVRYGDGVEVDVMLQVNDSVPPGRSIVVRPELEAVDGAWRQTSPAGVVLSSHAPPDPVARAAHVNEVLDTAWRALHDEVSDRLGPMNGRDPDAVRSLDDPAGPRGPETPGAVRGPDDAGAPRERVAPDALHGLEEPVRTDVPVRDADDVGQHRATPAGRPEPPPLTPETVRQAVAGRGGPEPIGRWAGEHLTTRADNGTLRPRTPEEIAATVRDLADEAVDLVTPRAEPAVPDGVRHTASPIADTGFVPDGRREAGDLSLQEVHDAAPRVLAQDFAHGDVSYIVSDGNGVRVMLGDGTAQVFRPEVGAGMRNLAETTMRSGTPEDPHIVRFNHRVADDQLSRVWLHEITETLALRHAEQTRPQPQGLVRRAVAAVVRMFGGGETPAPRPDPHTAARLSERNYLQRLYDTAGTPAERVQLRRELDGLDRDLAALGHAVDPSPPPRTSSADWLFTDRPAAGDGVIRGFGESPGRADADSGPARVDSDWGPARVDPDSGLARVDSDSGPARVDPDGAPARVDPDGGLGRAEEPVARTPEVESTQDTHWAERRWAAEGRRPSLDEVLPVTFAEADRHAAAVRRALTPILTGEYAGLRVGWDESGTPISVYRDTVDVRLKIYDGDREVGSTSRTFRREEGVLTVHNSSLRLNESVHGRGFAAEFNGRLDQWYRESGVRHVTVHAVDAGSFVWARTGFDWAGLTADRSALKIFGRVADLVRVAEADLRALETGRADIEQLRARYGGSEPMYLAMNIRNEIMDARTLLDRAARHEYEQPGYPTPREVTQIGDRGEGRGSRWLGKEAFLGAEWSGVRTISDGVVQHPRGEHHHGPGHHGDVHDLHRHGTERTNEDVLLNGSDVPFTPDSVARVAEMLGIDLTDVRVQLVRNPDDIAYLDRLGVAALTPVEARGREVYLGPAAFADAATLAATIAHEHTHVQQLRAGRDVTAATLRALEDEAYASEGPALRRFDDESRGLEHVGDGTVPGRGDLGHREPGGVPGDRGAPAGGHRAGGETAGRGDGDLGGGAGDGVPQSARQDDLRGGADRSDALGGRADSDDFLARRIGGRPDDPPFGYERFFTDPDFFKTAQRYEVAVGAHLFNDPATLDAARAAVAQLRSVITGLATDGVTDPVARRAIAAEVESTFFRSDDDAYASAGQVGRGVPLDVLLREGNLRELTTAFYNAAYFNRGGPHTFAAELVRAINEGRWAEAGRAGVDLGELRAVHDQFRHPFRLAMAAGEAGLRGVESLVKLVNDKFKLDAHRFARDPFATGNVGQRAGYRDLAELIRSQAGRVDIEAPDLKPSKLGWYDDIGAPLGRFERAFVEGRTGLLQPDSLLPWREGAVAHNTTGSGWARGAMRDGLSVIDGLSGTTARMMTAAKLLGLHGADGQRFLQVLMGWMLPARDHSLFEIMRGAEIAGTEGISMRPRPSGVEVHRSVPGVDLRTIRDMVAPDRMLPHEALYDARSKTFTETTPEVRDFAERIWTQLDTGRVTDPEVRDWLVRNDIDPADPAAVRAVTEGLSRPHVMALNVYTRNSHGLINAAIETMMHPLNVAETLGARFAETVKSASLVERYIKDLVAARPSEELPVGLRSVVHEGPGPHTTRSPLTPKAQEVLDLHRAAEDAGSRARSLAAAGDAGGAREAKAEAGRALRAMNSAIRDLGSEGRSAGARLFDEVRWHADMATDALRQLPAVGSTAAPVYTFRGDTAGTPLDRKYAGERVPDTTVRSVLSTSRSLDVAIGFMLDKQGPGDRVIAVYRLTGMHGRDISAFAQFPEAEVILPPGAGIRRVDDPDLAAQVRAHLPDHVRDQVRIVVLEER